MYRPPRRDRTVLADKKVLLIEEAEEISAARFLWQPHVYDLVMLDVRRYSPVETLEFYGEVMHRSPHEHFVFLLGPPKYVSRTWPDEVTVDDVSRGEWGETVKRFLAAA